MNINSGLKKKIAIFGIAAILAVGLCFAFGGCSSDEKKTDKASQSDVASDASKEVSSDAEATADSSSEAVSAEVSSDAGQQATEDVAVVPTQESEATPEAPAQNSEASSAQTSGGAAAEETKYGDAEVYTNDAGNPAAKTESGEEVEITGENLQNLIDDYQDVQGSGSAEEQELLDKIQLLLEAGQNANQ